MKEYHTSIIINATPKEVWIHLTDFSSYPDWNPIVGFLKGETKEGSYIQTYIVPLGKTFQTKLLVFREYEEMTWEGVQAAKFLMAGKHYYRLEKISDKQTKLLHGEWFTGLFSHFISKKLLQKMEDAFLLHNQMLKQRIENEK